MQNKITIEECQKLLEQNPFGSLLQMKITEAELGRVKAELPFKKEIHSIVASSEYQSLNEEKRIH